MKDYIIQFSGLKLGFHSFELQVGQTFFEHFDYGEIHKGSLEVTLEMEKKERMLILLFHIQGFVEIVCDRCGDPLEQPLNDDKTLFIKFGPEPQEESDDVIIISDRDYQIDVSHYIYEFINLMLPAKRTHGENESGKSYCNPDAINYLEENTAEPETDPRWDALKKLKNKQD